MSEYDAGERDNEEPDDEELLESQEDKGYGEDEGERDEALEEE